MNCVNVYERYFEAECLYNGVPRRAACVRLTSESGGGEITYGAYISFFPHETAEDFRISCDAEASEVLYSGRGRRSKKREAELLKSLEDRADALAESLGGRIFWDRPLIEARKG